MKLNGRLSSLIMVRFNLQALGFNNLTILLLLVIPFKLKIACILKNRFTFL